MTKLTKKAMMEKIQEVKEDYRSYLNYLKGRITENRMLKRGWDTTELERFIVELEEQYKMFLEFEKEHYKSANKKDDMVLWFDTVIEYDSNLWNSYNPTGKMIINKMVAKKEEPKKTVTSEQAFMSDFESYLDQAIKELA